MSEFSRYRREIITLCLLAGVMPTSVICQETERSKATIKILVVGDSLSAEYGLKRHSGWVQLLSQKLSQTHSNVIVVNASISGDTTSGGLSRLPTLLSRQKPDLIVLELGANDALRGLSLEATADNLNKMVKLSKDSGAAVLLAGMQIPPNYGKQYAEAFKDLFAVVAQKNNAGLIPFFLKDIATDRGQFLADGIHPNEAAQPVIAGTVLHSLEPMLKALLRQDRP